LSTKTGKYFIRISDFTQTTFHEFPEQSHEADIGTIKYIAPEVALTTNYNTKADIYSLGVILQNLFINR
jgi:serine/threonine protein kinase